jgi:hypothetical protein
MLRETFYARLALRQPLPRNSARLCVYDKDGINRSQFDGSTTHTLSGADRFALPDGERCNMLRFELLQIKVVKSTDPIAAGPWKITCECCARAHGCPAVYRCCIQRADV